MKRCIIMMLAFVLTISCAKSPSPTQGSRDRERESESGRNVTPRPGESDKEGGPQKRDVRSVKTGSREKHGLPDGVLEKPRVDLPEAR